MLAGHVQVADRAYISARGRHQFCRVGTLAMVGGQAHLTQDVPPYVTIDGLSSLVVGLNKIGLRRAGYNQAAIRKSWRVSHDLSQWLAMVDVLDSCAPFPTGTGLHMFTSSFSTVQLALERRARAAPRSTLSDTIENEPEITEAGGRETGGVRNCSSTSTHRKPLR